MDVLLLQVYSECLPERKAVLVEIDKFEERLLGDEWLHLCHLHQAL